MLITITHRHSEGVLGTTAHKFLAYLVILCFTKRHPKHKYCCSPKVKHFAIPQTFWADDATAIIC